VRALLPIIIILLLALMVPYLPIKAQNQRVPLYVAFVWHMHQPVYFPGHTISEYLDWDVGGGTTVRSIFEQVLYCYSIAPDIIRQYPHARATVHFTGSLMWQLDGLAQLNFEAHYGDRVFSAQGLWNKYRDVVASGQLEVVVGGFYHPIFPLIDSIDLANQISKARPWVSQHFGYEPSGCWPSELAFSVECVPTLAQLGIDWVIVDSSHIQGIGSWGSADYFRLACRPHLLKYGDYEIVVVPRERSLSEAQMSGFSADWLIQRLEEIEQYNTDPSKPFLVVIATDGENGWFRQVGGGYYEWFLPDFLDRIGPGTEYDWIVLTTISDYLNNVYYPDDYVQVERGSWAGDLSIWEGSSLDQQQWSRISETRTALFNDAWPQIESAAEQGKEVSKARSLFYRAYGYLLMAETSCYFFWDSEDWAQKTYTACDLALSTADQAINAIGTSGSVTDELGTTGWVPTFNLSEFETLQTTDQQPVDLSSNINDFPNGTLLYTSNITHNGPAPPAQLSRLYVLISSDGLYLGIDFAPEDWELALQIHISIENASGYTWSEEGDAWNRLHRFPDAAPILYQLCFWYGQGGIQTAQLCKYGEGGWTYQDFYAYSPPAADHRGDTLFKVFISWDSIGGVPPSLSLIVTIAGRDPGSSSVAALPENPSTHDSVSGLGTANEDWSSEWTDTDYLSEFLQLSIDANKNGVPDVMEEVEQQPPTEEQQQAQAPAEGVEEEAREATLLLYIALVILVVALASIAVFLFIRYYRAKRSTSSTTPATPGISS